MGTRRDGGRLYTTVGLAAAAAAIYVMCSGVGWIIAGFARD